jgi:heme-degrading monooxygenase HmoA
VNRIALSNYLLCRDKIGAFGIPLNAVYPKEEMMIVKVMIKRKIKEGKARDVFALLNKLRSDAMTQKGYISGETLINHDNPREILVISIWQDMDNWIRWRENLERKANEKMLERWLEEPTAYESFVFSTYYAQFDK